MKMSLKKESDIELFQTNIHFLKIMNLWPNENISLFKKKTKDLIFVVVTMIFSFGVLSETIRELRGLRDEMNDLLESLLSAGIVITTVSLILGYRLRQNYISNLIQEIRLLENYFIPSDLVETENRVRFFTKLLIYYTYVTDTMYTFLPFVQYKNCLKKQETVVHLKHVPCGMITPMWFPFDYKKSPVFQLIIFFELCYAYIFSVSVISIWMLNIGVTLHIIGHLRNLKKQFKIAIEDEKSLEKFKRCIKYHIEIIRFSNYANKCFSIFNFITTAVSTYMIGVLEYQIILETSLFESFRYGFHLSVWLTILFMLNYVAQLLINESSSVSDELYSINWLDCSISIKKDIIFILQHTKKPLMLKTGSFGIMGHETYLWILRSAYTFFAIFSNAKG